MSSLSDGDPPGPAGGAGARTLVAAPAAVMADVAALAGVSNQTVSRVLNGQPHVRDETRARVVRAMEQLGYRRNLTARALATRRSATIGVIAFDTALHGPASTVFSIEQAARQRGLATSVATVPDMAPEAFGEAVERLLEHSVEGVVVLTPQRSAVSVLGRLPAGLPTVAVEGGGSPGVASVVVDQLDGARQAVQHLVDLGHRRIVHLAGRHDWIEAMAREDGWRRTLLEAGLPRPEVERGDWSPASGYDCGRRLLGRLDDVDAVFAANDHMALGLLRAFAEAGVGVPSDVSVVGFDDIAEAAYLHPPLTTVRQDFAEVGRRCVDVLVGEMSSARAGLADAPHSVVPAELVVRDSSGPRPGAR